jgi:hypothetical protein
LTLWFLLFVSPFGLSVLSGILSIALSVLSFKFMISFGSLLFCSGLQLCDTLLCEQSFFLMT